MPFYTLSATLNHMSPEILVTLYLFMIFVGTFIAAYMPYLRKKNKDPDMTWETWYTVNLLYSFIASMIVTFMIWITNPLAVPQDPTIIEITTIAGTGLILGHSSNNLIKEVRKQWDDEV